MKEGAIVILLVGIFVIVGLGIFFSEELYSEFNFHKSEITINGNFITEKLYFKTDQQYHTLYRNFKDPIFTKDYSGVIIGNQYVNSNYIHFSNVSCLSGQAYIKDSNGKCAFFAPFSNKTSECLPRTETNEYGCSFGNALGFSTGNIYWVEAKYEVNPKNIFQINGKNYIKFVAYSKNEHKKLSEQNFVATGNVIKKSSYSTREDVIIYIPYDGEINGLLINQKDFEFDNSFWEYFLLLLIYLHPAILIFVVWIFFGREKTYADIPEELSMYPNERSAWKVAAYFHPPFNVLDKDFFATMLTQFYHKKIIDIQIKDKKPFVKILNNQANLDEVEREFLKILKNLKNKEAENGYFDISKSLNSWTNKSYVVSEFSELHKKVKKIGKEFIDEKGGHIITAILFVAFLGIEVFGFLITRDIYAFLLLVAFLIVMVIIKSRSSLFIRFNKSYYEEYQKWQAFRRYLSHSFTITQGGHKAVAIWNHYLVYATSLGVAKKVYKELKKANIIDEKHYLIYNGIHTYSGSFSGASSTGGSGGGFSGAAGGGIGGGGGGGR